MCERLLTRPSASNGTWLCCLLPLALATSYLHTHTALTACSSTDAVHRLLIVCAIGMCLKTLCFLSCSAALAATIIKYVLGVMPGILTSICFALLPETSWIFALAAGFLIPSVYHLVYVKVLRGLPSTFTYGEAAILVQGLILFVLNAVSRLCSSQHKPISDFAQVNVIMLSALTALLVVCLLLALFPLLRQPVPFYLLMALLALTVTGAPVTQPLPLPALLGFIFRDQKRLYIIGFYLVLVLLTAITVRWQLGSSQQASTRVRKIFHALIVLVFVPGIVYQCALLYIGTGIALAVFVVVELLRLLRMPPFADTLLQAFDSFKDVKDAGVLALTPFCLLIGCALPLWLSACPCERIPSASPLALLSGILAVGVGDTAASVVGSKMGRNKWPNSTRSLEGTVAFVVSIMCAVWLLDLTGLLAMTQAKWFATLFAALNSALVEAFTDQVDNLVLPLVFFILVGFA